VTWRELVERVELGFAQIAFVDHFSTQFPDTL
jgi:hypothetical protein